MLHIDVPDDAECGFFQAKVTQTCKENQKMFSVLLKGWFRKPWPYT